MQAHEFDNLVASLVASKPNRFTEVERPVGRELVDAAEAKIGCALPDQFKHFALTFEAGDFGRADISSLNPVSEFYRLDDPLELSATDRLLIVSDDHCGGYFGFRYTVQGCEDEVFYAYPDEADPAKLVYPIFFDFVLKVAVTFP